MSRDGELPWHKSVDPNPWQQAYDGWRVQVYCADQAHQRPGDDRPRRSEVARLLVKGGPGYEPLGDDEEPGYETPGYVMPAPAWDAKSRDWRAVWDELPEAVQDEYGHLRPTLKPSPERAVNNDRRWRFACSLCRRTVVVRDERLYPVLATLQVAGVSEISLVGLASRLR